MTKISFLSNQIIKLTYIFGSHKIKCKLYLKGSIQSKKVKSKNIHSLKIFWWRIYSRILSACPYVWNVSPLPFKIKITKFLVKIPLTKENLFHNYFFCLSVCNSFATYWRSSPCFFPSKGKIIEQYNCCLMLKRTNFDGYKYDIYISAM